MSLILEALRKSEAERRRALTPDLMAEPRLALPAQRPGWPRWTWVALAVTGLFGVALLARALWLPISTPAPVQAPPSAQHAHVVRSAPTPATTRDAAPERAPPVPLEAVQPAATASKPLEREAEASVPAPAVAAVAATAPAPPPAAPIASPVAAGPALPEPRETPEPVAASTTAAPPDSDADTLRLADLGAEERKQLPQLKLSMHLWNDAPGQRFVILDGQRLGEGDRIGDAVVEQITREGAILAWNGRRLRLSLR